MKSSYYTEIFNNFVNRIYLIYDLYLDPNSD